MYLPWSESGHIRSKRFVYNANTTCGYIAFCSHKIHHYDLVLNTSLADDPNCSKAGMLTSIVINIIMSIAIMFGNFMIVYIMSTKRKFKNPQGVFKTSLGLFDFIVGAIIIPSTIYNKISIMFVPLNVSYLEYLRPYRHSSISIGFGMLFSICISGSLFSLLALTVDRLMAVHWPFKYSVGKLMTRTRAAVAVVGIWFISVMLGVLAIGDEERFHYDLDYMTMNFMLEVRINPSRSPPNLRHGIFFLVLVFIIPYMCVVLVTAITWFMFWWNRRNAKLERLASTSVRMKNVASVAQTVPQENATTTLNTLAQTSDETSSTTPTAGSDETTAPPRRQPRTRSQKNKVKLQSAMDKDLERMTIIMVIMVACFTACVLPFLAVHANIINPYPGELHYIQKHGKRFDHEECKPVARLMVVELLFLNSLCNFVIYNLRNEAFRKEMQIALKAMSTPFTDRWRY